MAREAGLLSLAPEISGIVGLLFHKNKIAWSLTFVVKIIKIAYIVRIAYMLDLF
jgi:hypothetical protein